MDLSKSVSTKRHPGKGHKSKTKPLITSQSCRADMPSWAYFPKGKVMLMGTCRTTATARWLVCRMWGGFFLAVQQNQVYATKERNKNISALKTQAPALPSSSASPSGTNNRSWLTLHRLWALLGEYGKPRRQIMSCLNNDIWISVMPMLSFSRTSKKAKQKEDLCPKHLQCAVFDTISWLPPFVTHIKMLQLCHWTKYFSNTRKGMVTSESFPCSLK